MVLGWGTFTYGEKDQMDPGRSPGPKEGDEIMHCNSGKAVLSQIAKSTRAVAALPQDFPPPSSDPSFRKDCTSLSRDFFSNVSLTILADETDPITTSSR
ncbi:hypothetical protein Y032_0013g2085 [Ancylostoma ceylanicum]|uniref:Uncharacterized protein n=1 Tax=Ancylostoma ceylanicum TaxID=53326 RepID=A0A016VBC4_9BILA|nr:hypothetical protein Y032_0013g2085 [Ancylostoma ceylanicum]